MTEENKGQVIKCVKWAIIAILTLGVLKCGSDIAHELNAPKKPLKDSMKVSVTHDTIWPEPKVITLPGKDHWYSRIDTVLKPIIISQEDCNKTFLSLDTLDNEQITIYDSIYYQGKLRKKLTSYTLKVPLTVIDSVLVEKTKYVPTLYLPEYQLNAGLAVSTNLLAPTVSVSYNRHTVGVGYNIQNKQPILQYSFRLWHSKKKPTQDTLK